MSDIRSVSGGSTMPSESAESVEHLRKQIGGGFTDKPADKKKKTEMGKDDFMKLMSAQLKYQDPISPMKNEEMAAQLAQFSALEQMFNVNQNLEKMAAGQKPQENVLAASLIGKRVLTDGSKLHLEKDKGAEINFELPGDVAKGNVSVVNAKGEVIREMTLAGSKKGLQSMRWDGKTDKGQVQDPGEYSFRITAADKDNKPVQAVLSAAGVVTGVSFEKGKPLLLIGDKKLSMDSISKIEEATAKEPSPPATQRPVNLAADAKRSTPEVPAAGKQKILSDVEPQGTIESGEALVPQDDVALNDNPAMHGNSLWDPNRLERN